MGTTTFLSLVFGLLVFTACGSSHSKGPAPVPAPASRPVPPAVAQAKQTELREFGDILRERNPDVAKALSDPQFTAVTREFGFSVIHMDKLPFRSPVAVARVKPWSSWWFPKVDTLLFDEEVSPLAKYDIVRANHYQELGKSSPGRAAEFARDHHDPNANIWEGLCDAWTLAAISNPEPKHPVTIMAGKTPVTFSVSDLKALLLLTYEAVDDSSLRYYGQKFTGEYDSWIYPDIFPEQFHRFVEAQLFEKQMPFIMDHDPGPQIWTNPVYKANYIIDKVAGEPNAVFVRMWNFTAEFSPENDKNFVGTMDAVREYDYVLQGDRNKAGDLVVKSGYWVQHEGVNSRLDHPDYLFRQIENKKLVRKSWNPEIEVELVDKILSDSY